MNKKVYNMMDWAAIEEIVYAEADHPENTLGSHNVGKNSLVQAFFPGASKVTILTEEEKFTTGKKAKVSYVMDQMDEEGFFAALLTGKNRTNYTYKVEDADGNSEEVLEVYNNTHVMTEAEAEALNGGSMYEAYKMLGAHEKVINKVKGCSFAVWAPNAIRVSVIGDFNDWNGKIHQMMRIGDTGIFELFIPGVTAGAKYKFEVLAKGGNLGSKIDPYALSFDDIERDCVVTNLDGFKWTDKDFMASRKSLELANAAINIYELNLCSFSEVKDLKKLATKIASRCNDMGYTHVEIMPIAEYEDDNCKGFSTLGYYAPTVRYGSPDDYKAFVNELHNQGIGVILQWTVNSFSPSEDGLSRFDGTCLYEHEDYRKGVDTRSGQLIFNYLRPEVKEYLIGNAIYWANEYHIDGFKFNDVTSMLYLDYYRKPGEWEPNIYGGNENLDAITFLKKANKHIHKLGTGVFTIADAKSGFAHVSKTSDLSESELSECLGFDMTIGLGFVNDVLSYLSVDPIERSAHHNEIIDSMAYQYSENYLLPVAHSETDFGKGGIINRMFGNEEEKYANLRAFYGYMYTHPGKKEVFMGQEVADTIGFNGNEAFDFSIEKEKANKNFKYYIRSLNLFYLSHPALYEYDYSSKGFEWINNISANENVIAFVRSGKKKDDFLYVVVNFANCAYDRYKLGVPFKGKYREIFNSDELSYGGTGRINSRVIPSKHDECDGRAESVKINLAPLSIQIFEFVPYSEKELDEINARDAKREQKKNERELEKAQIAKKRALVREKLADEKAKIRASLKEELAKQIKEAEEKIAGGSENVNSKPVRTVKKKTQKK